MEKRKEKLYRKENKSSLSSHYNVVSGGEYRHERHSKKNKDFENAPRKTSMVSGKFQYDYTPFFRFMIAKVGTNFDAACSEAKPRMDYRFFEVLGWIFSGLNPHENDGDNSMFRCGESTTYPRLIVDENGLIQFKDPNYHNELKRL
jgi:hypothetical protein